MLKITLIILLLFFSKVIFSKTISLTPIAVVIELKGKVFRKHHNQIVFKTIFINDPIFLGDSLKTNLSSTLRIKLEKGPLLLIAPNSTITIDKN